MGNDDVPESRKAPEFPAGPEWINSSPLNLAELRDKVVLIDIWDYTCVNCLRTLPYLKEWNGRYARDGLVIIGVHTPEFEFGKDVQNVCAAVHRLGITYPVVLDNDYEIWSAYNNQYWPRKYVVDPDGEIVYDHIGEGDYYQTELIIQRLLGRHNRAVQFPEPCRSFGPVESGGMCYPVTPEIYFGYERGRLGNPERCDPETVMVYRDENTYGDGYVYANGPWLKQAQSLTHARKDSALKDYIAVKYHAMSVNAVIRPAGENSCRVYVLQDNAAVPEEDRGEDLLPDAEGRTYLEVDESRMYRIIRNRKFGSHVLKVSSPSDSFDIYSFTFGSCKVGG